MSETLIGHNGTLYLLRVVEQPAGFQSFVYRTDGSQSLIYISAGEPTEKQAEDSARGFLKSKYLPIAAAHEGVSYGS